MTSDSTDTMLRQGPRPLGLHLGLSALTLSSSFGALAMSRTGALPWIAELREDAEAIEAQLNRFDITQLSAVLAVEGQAKITAMMAGIEQYHQHPYTRSACKHVLIWSNGNISLRDGAPNLPVAAPIVLLVPSLVNKSYILDLMPGRSFLVALADAGIRPLLVDWDVPGENEKNYQVEDYVLGILGQILDHIQTYHPESDIHLAGYCMGGTLSVALAQYRQTDIASLIAIATPWNFHEDLGQAAKGFLKNEALWSTILNGFDELPVDILQAFFASLDPNLCLNKFSNFSKIDPQSDRANVYVALEDWLNDGVPLAGHVAQACFVDWYGNNLPVTGKWKVGPDYIRPEKITIPSMIAIPKADRIVPPASAMALALQLPNAHIRNVGSGHIGMMVGGGARQGLWQDVIDWVRNM